MNKVEKIIEYYVLTNKLKDVVRTGWKYWNIKRDRLESVAEHIYGTCMLATAIWSETLPAVNLAEVLMTLAVHETEEVIIGDLTPHDPGYADKKEKGEQAIEEIFKDLMCKEYFTTLIKNFDEKSTPEAIFAYKCDKLECDLQVKLYEEEGCAKFDNAMEKIKKDPKIAKLHERGLKKVSSFFFHSDKTLISKYAEDEEDMFLQILKYLEKNNIKQFDRYPLKKSADKKVGTKTPLEIAQSKKIEKK